MQRIVQLKAMQCDEMQCNAMQGREEEWNEPCAVRCNSVQSSPFQCNSVQQEKLNITLTETIYDQIAAKKNSIIVQCSALSFQCNALDLFS